MKSTFNIVLATILLILSVSYIVYTMYIGMLLIFHQQHPTIDPLPVFTVFDLLYITIAGGGLIVSTFSVFAYYLRKGDKIPDCNFEEIGKVAYVKKSDNN